MGNYRCSQHTKDKGALITTAYKALILEDGWLVPSYELGEGHPLLPPWEVGRRNDGVRDTLNRQRNWETWTERRLEDGARNGKCMEDDCILRSYGRVTFEPVRWL